MMQHHRRRRHHRSGSGSSRGRLLLLLLSWLRWRGRECRRRLRVNVIAEEVVLVGHVWEGKKEEKKDTSEVFL